MSDCGSKSSGLQGNCWSLCTMEWEKSWYASGTVVVMEGSELSRGGADTAGPGEGVGRLGATESAAMGPHSLGMRAAVGTSADVVIDTYFFTVGGAKSTVRDFGPNWLTVGKLGRVTAVAVVFRDRVADLTAE